MYVIHAASVVVRAKRHGAARHEENADETYARLPKHHMLDPSREETVKRE
jgi:hypothetical protein